jgi:thiamine-phosphate pyrophosphorylase
MHLKNNIDWSFYAIIDAEWLRGRSAGALAKSLVLAGAGVIQYRDKINESGAFYRAALEIRESTANSKTVFIVNDRVDIALAAGADGVHLGQNDMPEEAARRLMGPAKLIGISVNSLEELTNAGSADYVGVGAVYPTGTKSNAAVTGLEIVRSIRQNTRLPIVGIGGINAENLDPVFDAGADGVAVISAILGSDDIDAAAELFAQAVRRARSVTSQSARRPENAGVITSRVKFCDLRCEHADFPHLNAIDGSGSCRTFSAVWCKRLGEHVTKNAPCSVLFDKRRPKANW